MRIPGWLIALALLIGIGLWGGRCVANAVDNSGSEFARPNRITALQVSFENRVLTANVLVEANESLESRTLGFAIILDDGSPLPAAARELGGGAWPGRSYVMALERLIPEGRTPAFLQVNYENGSASLGLAEVLD